MEFNKIKPPNSKIFLKNSLAILEVLLCFKKIKSVSSLLTAFDFFIELYSPLLYLKSEVNLR